MSMLSAPASPPPGSDSTISIQTTPEELKVQLRRAAMRGNYPPPPPLETGQIADSSNRTDETSSSNSCDWIEHPPPWCDFQRQFVTMAALGEGRYGRVDICMLRKDYDLNLPGPVFAVKRLKQPPPDMAHSLENESRLNALLAQDSAGPAELSDHFVLYSLSPTGRGDNPQTWLGFPYVFGRDLQSVFYAVGVFPVSFVFSVLKDVLDALVIMHQRGRGRPALAHLDLHSANIVVDFGPSSLQQGRLWPRAKLVDFGNSARIVEDYKGRLYFADMHDCWSFQDLVHELRLYAQSAAALTAESSSSSSLDDDDDDDDDALFEELVSAVGAAVDAHKLPRLARMQGHSSYLRERAARLEELAERGNLAEELLSIADAYHPNAASTVQKQKGPTLEEKIRLTYDEDEHATFMKQMRRNLPQDPDWLVRMTNLVGFYERSYVDDPKLYEMGYSFRDPDGTTVVPSPSQLVWGIPDVLLGIAKSQDGHPHPLSPRVILPVGSALKPALTIVPRSSLS